MTRWMVALLFLSFFMQGMSQEMKSGKLPRVEDVGTIDGIVRAFYDIVTGPKGQPRDWDRDKTLYVADVKFVSISRINGQERMRTMTHEEFIASSNDFLVSNGFFENEIHRVTHRFGNMASVWSTYESRTEENGPLTGRGINSLQLVYDGKRWWIQSAVWQQESSNLPVPEDFLPDSQH